MFRLISTAVFDPSTLDPGCLQPSVVFLQDG